MLGASQAGALPAIEVKSPPGFLLVQAAKPGEQPGPEQKGQGNQQAPLAELHKLLDDTRAKLDQLFGATAVVAEQRKEIEALKQQTARLAGERDQAITLRTELESSRKVAEGRIAELSTALDAAVAKAVRVDEDLTGVRRQNANLEERIARAEAARKAAEVNAEETRTELQAKLNAATAAAEQSRSELAELRQNSERAGQELAATRREREQVATRAREMEQDLEHSGAEAERVKTELAAVKEQLGQAANAAVEAERARQAASGEAEQLRGTAERAREELAAAKGEIARFTAANADLEKQVADLHADSESAMETARQNLVVMEEKIEELHDALAGAGLVQTKPTGSAPGKSGSAADERSSASDPLAGMAQPAAMTSQVAPEPADKRGAAHQEVDSPARLAARGPATEPAQDDRAELARFDANVRYLNNRAFELAGADLFSGIEAAGDGVVHVSTTAAWRNIPPAGQRSYLNSLFDLWRVGRDENGPTVVRIVDASGRVLLEKSGTGQHRAGD